MYGCSPDKENDKLEIKRLSFTENDSLLAASIEYTDLKIKLKSPINSVELSKKEISAVSNQLQNLSLDNYSSEIFNIFIIKDKNIIFSVSKVVNNKFESYAELLQFLNANYLPDFKNRRFIEFFKDDVYMAQFMCFNDKNLVLKTFIKNKSGNDIELNFLMPAEEYNTFSKTIESVIASVKYM